MMVWSAHSGAPVMCSGSTQHASLCITASTPPRSGALAGEGSGGGGGDGAGDGGGGGGGDGDAEGGGGGEDVGGGGGGGLSSE